MYSIQPEQGKRYYQCKGNLPRKEAWRLLPYGAWHTRTGEIVLFNRWYQPLFRRTPDGRVEQDDPRRWVEGVAAHVWFYNGCSLRHGPITRLRVQDIQQRWQEATSFDVPLAELLPSSSITNMRVGLAA